MEVKFHVHDKNKPQLLIHITNILLLLLKIAVLFFIMLNFIYLHQCVELNN